MANVGVIILAAGGSSRMGAPKQLLRFEGQTLLRRAVGSALESSAETTVVVLGANAGLLRDELRGLPVHIVENPHWPLGIGTSIRAGLKWIAESRHDLDAVILMLCDQPFVTAKTLDELMKVSQSTGKPMIASAYDRTLGVPALFSRSCFAELLAIKDGAGAKPFLLSHVGAVGQIACPEARVDLDTPSEYESLLRIDRAQDEAGTP